MCGAVRVSMNEPEQLLFWALGACTASQWFMIVVRYALGGPAWGGSTTLSERSSISFVEVTAAAAYFVLVVVVVVLLPLQLLLVLLVHPVLLTPRLFKDAKRSHELNLRIR